MHIVQEMGRCEPNDLPFTGSVDGDGQGKGAVNVPMFSIIDSRYRCNKPLIVTTNLKLDELKHPPDLAHARIYDRILERCAPILFAGKNFREDNAVSTKAAARQIITSTAVSHRQTATEKGEL